MVPGRVRSILARDPFLPIVIRRRDAVSLRIALPGLATVLPGDRWIILAGSAFDRVAIDQIEDIETESVPEDYTVSQEDTRSRQMTTEKFDEFLRRKPFVPFTIHTGDGASFEVKSPEFASRTQGGRTIFVSTGGEATEWIDLLLVTRISSGVSNIGSTQPPTGPQQSVA